MPPITLKSGLKGEYVMAKRTLVAFFALILASWGFQSSVGAEGEPLILAFRPPVGSSYIQRDQFDYSMSFDPDGEAPDPSGVFSQGMGIKMGIMTKAAVRATDDQKRTVLDMTFLALRYDASILGGAIPFSLDTTDPFTSPMGPLAELAALVGEGCTLIVDARGRLARIEGWQEMSGRIAKRLGLSEQEKGAFEERWGDTMKGGREGDGYPNNYAAGLYPETPVRVGDSWTSIDSSYMQGFHLMSDNTFHLKSRRNGVAVIEVRSRIRSRTAEVKTAAAGNGPEMIVSGGQTALVEMDEATGVILKIELKQLLLGEMIAPDQESGNMTSVGFSWQGKYSQVTNWSSR